MAVNIRGYNVDAALEAEQPRDNVIGGDSALRGMLSQEWQTCQNAIRYFALDWDEYEDLLFVQSRTPDNLHVRISEGSLSTIVIERAGRVVSQLPSGVVQALGIKNVGQGLLYNLLVNNWFIPNANEQYDFETKLFLWDMYSNVYGTMGMMYDWCYREDYSGPDCWLIPMRNLWPQQGRFSTANSDYMFVSTFLSRPDLQNIVDEEVEGYDLPCIDELLTTTAGRALLPASANDYLRNNPMWQYRRRAPLTDTGQFEIVTKYESGGDGRWIGFFADYDNKVMRNIPNPHQDGRIPVSLKFALPTLDSPIGLGDMEKGRFMQYGIDTVLNLSVDYQKIHTYPPLKVIMQNVLMPSIRFQPAAKWGVSSMEDIGHHELPQADQSQNQAYQWLKGSMANVLGDSSSQVPVTSNAQSGQAKSPQALKDSKEDQSTRDALDLKFFQKAYEYLMDGVVNMINTYATTGQAGTIDLDLFDDDIKQLMGQGYYDIKDIVQWAGKANGVPIDKAKSVYLKIPSSKLANKRGLRFKMDANSTQTEDQETQHTQYGEILTDYSQNAASIEALLNAGGMTVDFPELYKQWLISGGIRQWNNVLKPLAQSTPAGQVGATPVNGTNPAAGQGAQPGAAPGQATGAQAPAQQPDPRISERMEFKDVAAVAPQAGAAMLGQAGLPGQELMDAQPQPPTNVAPQQPMSTPMSPQPGQPQAAPSMPAGVPGLSQDPTHDPSYMIKDPQILAAYQAVRTHRGGSQ